MAIVLVVLIVFVIIVLVRSVRIIPQARAGVVERLGKYQRTLNPGLTILIPFVDRLLPLLDLREQVVSFPPAARHHRGQPRGVHRYRGLFPGH